MKIPLKRIETINPKSWTTCQNAQATKLTRASRSKDGHSHSSIEGHIEGSRKNLPIVSHDNKDFDII